METLAPPDTMYDPRLYDIEMEGRTSDLPYWESLLEQLRPRRVLELACGTGRLTLPLALRGRGIDPRFQIVGLDVSADALAKAQEKQRELTGMPDDTVVFVEADMRSFDLKREFDLIIIGLNSFAHIHDSDDHLRCLRAVRRHLAPQARFAFDLPTPYRLWNRSDLLDTPPLRLMRNYPVPALGIKRFLQFAAHSYNPMTQTYRLDYVSELHYEDGRQERFLHDVCLHIFFPRELLMLLRTAGLTPIERYGSYTREPFHPRSWQYLWVMEAGEPASGVLSD